MKSRITNIRKLLVTLFLSILMLYIAFSGFDVKVNAAEPVSEENISASSGFVPVPLKQLANYKSIKKKMTDAEFQQAYDAALKVVTPLAGLSREDQIVGIANALRAMFNESMYSMTNDHYNDPYGYFILGTASCAGCTRATGLCLNILGMPYEHVNENQYTHQWCRVNINGKYWICDAFGLYAGSEEAPYQHPIMSIIEENKDTQAWFKHPDGTIDYYEEQEKKDLLKEYALFSQKVGNAKSDNEMDALLKNFRETHGLLVYFNFMDVSIEMMRGAEIHVDGKTYTWPQ